MTSQLNNISVGHNILINDFVSEIKVNDFIVENNRIKRNLNFKPTRTDYEYGYAYEYENKENFNTGIEYLKNMNKVSSSSKEHRQLYMRPNLAPVLIELIKFYRWPSIYFIYNHEHGALNLASLVQYQLENQNYLISNVLKRIYPRKVTDVKKCREMLR